MYEFMQKNDFADQLATALKQDINRMTDYNVKVIPTLFKCVDDSTALYDVEIMGNMVNNTYKYLQDIQIVELGIATLTICNQSCEALHTNVFDQQEDDKSSDSSVVIGLSVSLSFILICIIVIAALFCVKYR